MKSRAIIRNRLFQTIKHGESVVITDPKGELYGDTAELYRKNGYVVRVLNLVNPERSDSWNCMSDLNGDTLMAQVLTNVIIGNTSSGKGDHFWDNGEGNLLKALILMVDQDKKLNPNQKNLTSVYQMLTQNSEGQLIAKFNKLPLDHPARGPYGIFKQAASNLWGNVFIGLGSRMNVSRKIGEYKKENNIAIIQTARWDKVFSKVLEKGKEYGLSEKFLSDVFTAIHEASVEVQNEIISRKD